MIHLEVAGSNAISGTIVLPLKSGLSPPPLEKAYLCQLWCQEELRKITFPDGNSKNPTGHVGWGPSRAIVQKKFKIWRIWCQPLHCLLFHFSAQQSNLRTQFHKENCRNQEAGEFVKKGPIGLGWYEASFWDDQNVFLPWEREEKNHQSIKESWLKARNPPPPPTFLFLLCVWLATRREIWLLVICCCFFFPKNIRT